MLALSDENRALLLARQDLLTRADLYVGGAFVETVPVVGGSITVDDTATNRRTLTCQIANVDRWLPLLDNPLIPLGAELAIFQAPRRTDGTAVDWIPVGVFAVRAPTVVDTGGRALSVEGRDRSQKAADATFDGPFTITGGTNTVTAILTVLAPILGGVTVTATTTLTTTPALTFEDGDDRWQRATEMAGADGLEMFFDASGGLVIQDIPDPSVTPEVWIYAEGPGALVSSVTQSLDADQTYSHAVAIGQNPDPTVVPVRGDAYDADPASPTYYLGPFGDRRVRLVSPFITTQTQADNAAAALLRRKSGLLENVSAVVYPNPAQEAGDVILVERLALGVLARYVVSRFDLPLGPGVSNLSNRARRVA